MGFRWARRVLIGNFAALALGVWAPLPTTALNSTAAQTSPESVAYPITEQGFRQSTLTLAPDQGLVFFLNQTTSRSLTVDIDFGGTKKHCWSENMRDGGNGHIVTARPLVPGDFVTACFPERGRYQVRVSGLSGFPRGVTGQIVVE